MTLIYPSGSTPRTGKGTTYCLSIHFSTLCFRDKLLSSDSGVATRMRASNCDGVLTDAVIAAALVVVVVVFVTWVNVVKWVIEAFGVLGEGCWASRSMLWVDC